jgi:hypothetical protein
MKNPNNGIAENHCSASKRTVVPGFFVMRVFSHIQTIGLIGAKTALLSAFCLLGCEQEDGGTLDVTGTPPVLTNGYLSPDTVNIDTVTPSQSLYSITTAARVRATDADGDLTIVTVRILKRNSSNILVEIPLNDKGENGDSVASDEVFSGSLEFQIPRSDAGPYRIEFLANDANSDVSNLFGATFLATRTNSPPTLDTTSLVAPDSVTRPQSGSLLVFMSIAAADSDGLGDVRSVFFINLASQTQTPQFLLDDGGVPQEGGVASGDILAGDGVFSIIIQVPSTVPLGVYPFSFRAVDTFGDSSAAFIHELTVE